ncbi:MAG: type II toxin-antitoxin system VapC family toxin [Sphingobium sp.]
MYLLDTNICIYFTRGRSERLRARMREMLPVGLAMSAITYGELSVGSRHSADPAGDTKLLNALVQVVPVKPFDRAAADAYGMLARSVGVQRKSFDRLIAAHALALGDILVTNNEADFADIPGLKVENWTI